MTVGNERDNTLRHVTLKEYMSNLDKFTENGKTKSLWAARDDQGILVSTASILRLSLKIRRVLPLKDGKVEFNVQLFNYEYDEKDPQVLAVVVSDQGSVAPPA